MNFFGEYLVEAGYVSEQHLVEALLEQQRSTPTFAELLYSAKKVTGRQLLQIFKKQTAEQIDFKTAAQRLGFWNDEWVELVALEVENRRIPLGQILVKNGHITPIQLNEATTLFLEERNGPRSASQPAAPAKKKGSGFLESPTGHRVAEKLIAGFTALPQLSPTEFATQINLLKSQVRMLGGSARLFEDAVTEEVSRALEEQINRVDPTEASSLAEIGKQTLAYLLSETAQNACLDTAKQSLPKLFLTSQTAPVAAPPSPQTASPADGKKRVLVVDDSKAVHAFVDECLASSGYFVKHVMNGAEALNVLAQEKFDVVLLDWEMPTMTGPETFTEIKKRNIESIVIMMTSRNSEDDISLMITAGVNEYIMKPFNNEVLTEKLAMCMESITFNAAA